MTLEIIRCFLGWCTIINLGMLLFWGLALILAHDSIYRFHNDWFKISEERFDAIHYSLIGVYKLGIILFNIAPYFALHIMENF